MDKYTNTTVTLATRKLNTYTAVLTASYPHRWAKFTVEASTKPQAADLLHAEALKLWGNYGVISGGKREGIWKV